jgi:glycosyltransferase involved in cell wall biosynthesis
MKLSIIIPAYNEETRIGDCLRSIEEERKHSGIPVEVIVVNNASTDTTAEIASAFHGVIVVDESKKGIVYARARGFTASHGDLIANIDADTRMPQGWITRVMKEFSLDDNLVALSGPYIYYDLSFIVRGLVKIFYAVGLLTHLFNQYVLKIGAMLQGGNFVVRRDALEKIGGYDTRISFYGEDTDIARVGKVKWTFGLPMLTSGRRLAKEGILKMGLKYGINFIWTTFFKRPFSTTYTDFR